MPETDTISPSEALPVRAVTLFSSGVAYTLRELDAQETRLQTLQAQVQQRRAEAQEAQADLRAYLDTLEIVA